VDDHSRLAYSEILVDQRAVTAAGFLLSSASTRIPWAAWKRVASAVHASFSQIVFGETLFINQDSDPAPG
jgi:hypothetical protein